MFEKLMDKLAVGRKEKLITLGFYCGLWIYLEVMLHLVVFKGVGLRIIFPILFGTVFGTLYYLLGSLFPTAANRWVGLGLTLGTTIYFEVQLVYHCIFHSFLPVSQMVMGGAAVTNFSMQVLHGIFTNFHWVFLIFLPVFAAFILLIWKKWVNPLRIRSVQIPAVLMAGILFSGLTAGALYLTHHSGSSVYSILVNDNSSTETCIKNVGVGAATIQEGRAVLFPQRDPLEFEKTTLHQAEKTEKEYNATVNFSKLEKGSAGADHQALNRYFSKRAPTEKNAYTGLLKDYNLITVCAEAYCPYLIDPELTPTLYQLSTNGFVFENFYCSFQNTTTNGEYGFCTGLMPNLSRNKQAASFEDSKANAIPYSLANAFGKVGVKSYAYHDYFGTFYNRNVTHKNLGYAFKAIDSGLEIPVGWPSSDLEMVQASAPEYLSKGEQFHAYYMTFSGHYQYDWDNTMSAKNQAKVEHLPYSEPVKAYLACNLELEYALQELMRQLEAAGVADQTAIVLTADHYPYGLTLDQYSELAGFEVESTFERFRSSFICYVPGMEPVKVPDYCCTVDILPTLLNLFGLEYDSRLLAGRDVLAPGEKIAVLSDQSFITKDFRYDASTGMAYNNQGETFSSPRVEEYCNYVQNLFTFSNGILRSDYYRYIQKYQ